MGGASIKMAGKAHEEGSESKDIVACNNVDPWMDNNLIRIIRIIIYRILDS